MSNSAPFPIDPQLTGIAIAYRNRQLIADEVLPRVKPVNTKQFSYTYYPPAETFTIPDTRVGRRGRPNTVEFSGQKLTSEALDYGLDDEIPQDDIDQANNAINKALARPEERAAEFVANLIALDREVRAANAVFNAAAYAASNKTQLVGGTQWSNPAVDAVAGVSGYLEGLLMRPNVAVFGGPTWAALRRNPFIVKAVNKSSGDSGLVSRKDFAEVFELEEVLVGGAFVNTAKKGQNPVMARAWGKHAAFIYRDKLADNERGVTFGMTVPYGEMIAGSKPDSDIGLRGGVRVRVGETVKELITAPDAGFFVQDAVA